MFFVRQGWNPRGCAGGMGVFRDYQQRFLDRKRLREVNLEHGPVLQGVQAECPRVHPSAEEHKLARGPPRVVVCVCAES